jgi:hypothetical protein
MSRRHASILATSALFVVSTATYADDPRVASEARGTPDEAQAFHGLLDSRIREGFRVSPVELNLRGKNRALVGLGSYLVNAAGGCNDCHTNPPFAAGGDPFQGETEIINAERYLAGGRPFGPTLVSKNLTPDADGRPAGLTFEEFATTIRTGRDPREPDHILQVMPWNIYGKLTQLDLRAIYEFLSAIPSQPDTPPAAPPAQP